MEGELSDRPLRAAVEVVARALIAVLSQSLLEEIRKSAISEIQDSRDNVIVESACNAQSHRQAYDRATELAKAAKTVDDIIEAMNVASEEEGPEQYKEMEPSDIMRWGNQSAILTYLLKALRDKGIEL
jgi:BarA-like signal transduction histidine kinase